MSKSVKSKKSAVLKVDPYLEGLMSKLMDRLGSLERKMDSVLSRVSGGGAPVAQRPQGGSPQPPQTSYSNPHPMVEPKNLPRHERRPMFEAVCADCKETCEVPFRPSEGRAIYCKPCFAKRRSEGRAHSAPGSNPSSQVSNPFVNTSASNASASSQLLNSQSKSQAQSTPDAGKAKSAKASKPSKPVKSAKSAKSVKKSKKK
jgi:CxxC-x17-CxxC domain-containing protein